MKHKKLLLVLDDCWDPKHEELLNFIDIDSGSKVLISSRVRNVIDSSSAQSTAVVDIKLPSEDDALRMLISTAGLTDGGIVPTQAREVVKFCNFLPLSISIAGKLVADLGVGLESDDDWEGIVELLREEFAGEKRTVEESVIAASLNSIRGPHRENVMHLFKSLALLPEDCEPPVQIISMMCESVALTDGSFMKRPNVLNARRWIKQLIDRSPPTLAAATCFATTGRLLWSRVPRVQVAGAGNCRQTPSPVSNVVETLMSECCCHTVMHIHKCCYIAMLLCSDIVGDYVCSLHSEEVCVWVVEAGDLGGWCLILFQNLHSRTRSCMLGNKK